MAPEVKTVHAALRATGGARSFSGYASIFGKADAYNDVVERGAFTDTIADRKGRIAMLLGHDAGRPVGVWDEIREDSIGLFVRGHLTATPANDELHALLRDGAITGLSIGFQIPPNGATRGADGVRRIHKTRLFEISVVVFPAMDDARIAEVKRLDLQLGRHQADHELVDRFESVLVAKMATMESQIGWWKQTGEARVDDAIVAEEARRFRTVEIMGHRLQVPTLTPEEQQAATARSLALMHAGWL